MSRFRNREIISLDRDLYREYLLSKGRRDVLHYNSPNFPVKTVELTRQLHIENYVWSTGDNYYKLAQTKYENRDFWWVIGWFNEKPSDAMIKKGEVIKIPRPVETILSYFYRGR